MATEAQRLISISLAKIAASRCVRGGVSLHKNLLVATVLQKARYIFMEEAFQMVHGTYLNQANSKFIQQLRDQEQLEHELRQNEKEFDEDDSTSTIDDSDLDLFASPIGSNESLNFLSDSNRESGSNSKHNANIKESNPSLASTSTNASSDLIYLDLDINRVKPQDEQSSNSISGHKRRLSESEFDSDGFLSVHSKSKQIKLNHSESTANDITTDLSLDFLSNDLSLTSSTPTHTATANVTMAPLDMSSNSSNTSASSSSIDRITSLVSIFNFGNLQRSVSQPDLCSTSSSSDNSCCNLTQRQIAMTV